MADGADDPGRSPAQVLSAELAALRRKAGNPSFRKMAERSGRISHATLHEAVRGTRFPSWDTTREFVRACDSDELPWRLRWEELKGLPLVADAEPDAAKRTEPQANTPPDTEPDTAPSGTPSAASGPEPAVVSPVGDGVEPVISSAPAAGFRPRRLSRRKYALAMAAVVVLVLGAVAAVVVPKLGTSTGDVGARIPGDNSRFVTDVTVPDGTTIHVGETVQKVWEIENSGSVPWHERYLQRMDLPPAPGSCRTPDRVLVGDTAPGEHVMVSVPVTAADHPGSCWIGWKMVDSSGAQLFTTRRPVYVLVTVAP
ncbi:hypothetical protein GCM10022222_24470 [Amycolatopsis ultiminotia]|uniref:Nbr1 FW domain-containing protein n=1 Tax=Amycolatopsis ultiminotia TaxID=543629 RepID=A0ABP6VVC7_9PSEU